jgi:Haem-degrading
LSKLPHVMFFGGGVVIKLGDETIGAIGASGRWAGQDSRQVKVRPQALCAGRAITTVTRNLAHYPSALAIDVAAFNFENAPVRAVPMSALGQKRTL